MGGWDDAQDFHDGSDPSPGEDLTKHAAYLGNFSDAQLTRMAAAATASSLAIFAKRNIVVSDEDKGNFQPERPATTQKDTVMDEEKILAFDAAKEGARKQQQGDGSRENPFRARSAGMLKQILGELGIEVRRNIRARKIEFASSEGAPLKWEAADDGMTADLREQIAKRYWQKARTAPEARSLRFKREEWTDFLAAIGHHRKVDPFLEWLSDLPPWDGIPRIEHILSDLFGCEDDDLTRWASRAPFVGCVQRAHCPGYPGRTLGG